MINSYRRYTFYGKIIFFISLLTPFKYFVKYSSIKNLNKLSHFMAKLIAILDIKSAIEIKNRIHLVFNNSRCVNKIFERYLTNLYYHLFLTIRIPYMKELEVEKLLIIDSESQELLTKIKYSNHKILFASSHNYQFILMKLLSTWGKTNNIKILTTFALKEEKIFSNYISKLKKKLFYSYHYSVNISDKDYKSIFKKHLENANYTLMFGDVRFQCKKKDVKFQVNNLTCFSNSGLKNMIQINQTQRIFFTSLNKEGFKFRFVIREINDLSDYYENLKYNIKKHPSDWLLWFHSPLFK